MICNLYHPVLVIGEWLLKKLNKSKKLRGFQGSGTIASCVRNGLLSGRPSGYLSTRNTRSLVSVETTPANEKARFHSAGTILVHFPQRVTIGHVYGVLDEHRHFECEGGHGR